MLLILSRGLYIGGVPRAMKITSIESIPLRFEYERGFEYAGGKCTGRVTHLVRVHTDTGQTGIGSVYTHPGLAHLIIKHQLEPLLLGEDATEVERLWDRMYRLTRWYGRKGAAMSALGALDTAFWDLRGQAEGQPVWRMLGGSSGQCPAYGSALLWKKPEALAKEARELIERGFRRVKMRLGRDPDFDKQATAAVRNAIGSEHDLLIDGSMRYGPDTARRLALMLEKHNCFWLEEPFEPENLDAFAALRKEANIPLAAGENEFGEQGFRELIRAGAVDIIQPDASRCGGITEVIRAADLAATAGLKVATHSWSDAIAILANAHVIAAHPAGLTVEVDQAGNPFVENLLKQPLQIEDGMLTLPDAPGLGIELDESVIEKHRLPDPLALPDGAYSDMLFGADHWNPAPPYPAGD